MSLTAEDGRVDVGLLELPSYPRRKVERENWLSKQRRPTQVAVGGIALTLSPAAVEPLIARRGGYVHIALAGVRSATGVLCPPEALTALLARTFPDVTAADVPEDVLPLLVEEALSDFIATVEFGTGEVLRVESITVADAIPPAVDTGFIVSENGLREFPVLLESRPDLDAWIEGIPAAPVPWNGLAVDLAFWAGVTYLGPDELADIKTGDVVIVDGCLLSANNVACVINDSFAQACAISPDGIVLQGPVLAKSAQVLRTFFSRDMMTENDTPPPSQATPGALGDLRVKMVFEIGRVEVPIDKLNLLGAGHVFDLGKEPRMAVDVLAGGRKIGTGDLVRIGDTIGVRISSLSR